VQLSDFSRETLTRVSGWMTADPLETDRLVLRPFEEAAFPDIFEYAVQKEQQRLSGNPAVSTEADAREVFAFLSERRAHPPTTFAVVLRGTGKVIGNFSISVHPFLEADEALRDRRGVSLSFVLNERFQRRGYMTELLTRALDYYLGEHDLDYVNCGYFEFNEGSRRLQHKVGMRYYTEHIFPNGNIRVEEMILSREEYEARKQQ
jgi:ribosomal-protein-alanine N-acetyltransferase